MNFFPFWSKEKELDAPKLMDINRVRIRLEGLSQYASVTALLLNAALRLPTPGKLDGRKYENVLKVTYAVSLTATILAAMYTVMIFSMLSLYAKTFLGMGMDEEYLEFFKKTTGIRESAFISFLFTVLSFFATFILSLSFQYEGRLRYWLSTASFVFVAFGLQHFYDIMRFASVAFEK